MADSDSTELSEFRQPLQLLSTDLFFFFFRVQQFRAAFPAPCSQLVGWPCFAERRRRTAGRIVEPGGFNNCPAPGIVEHALPSLPPLATEMPMATKRHQRHKMVSLLCPVCAISWPLRSLLPALLARSASEGRAGAPSLARRASVDCARSSPVWPTADSRSPIAQKMRRPPRRCESPDARNRLS